jgi:hypothetical protein
MAITPKGREGQSSTQTEAPQSSSLVSDDEKILWALRIGLAGFWALTFYCILSWATVLSVVALCVTYVFYKKYKKTGVGHVTLKDKIILITGCDTGE